jgi:outer membrane autotransporter protein
MSPHSPSSFLCKLAALAIAFAVSSQTQAVAATTISGSTFSSPLTLGSSANIVNGGTITVNTSPDKIALTIGSGAVGGVLNVDTGVLGKGVVSYGGGYGAIDVLANNFTVNLISGTITADAGITMYGADNSVVNISKGAVFSNTAADGLGIVLSYTPSFTLNNAGTIKVGNGATGVRPNAIAVINDDGYGSTVNITNTGLIDSGIGTAVLMIGNATNTTVTNKGTIIGSILSEGDEAFDGGLNIIAFDKSKITGDLRAPKLNFNYVAGSTVVVDGAIEGSGVVIIAPTATGGNLGKASKATFSNIDVTGLLAITSPLGSAATVNSNSGITAGYVVIDSYNGSSLTVLPKTAINADTVLFIGSEGIGSNGKASSLTVTSNANINQTGGVQESEIMSDNGSTTTLKGNVTSVSDQDLQIVSYSGAGGKVSKTNITGNIAATNNIYVVTEAAGINTINGNIISSSGGSNIASYGTNIINGNISGNSVGIISVSGGVNKIKGNISNGSGTMTIGANAGDVIKGNIIFGSGGGGVVLNTGSKLTGNIVMQNDSQGLIINDSSAYAGQISGPGILIINSSPSLSKLKIDPNNSLSIINIGAAANYVNSAKLYADYFTVTGALTLNAGELKGDGIIVGGNLIYKGGIIRGQIIGLSNLDGAFTIAGKGYSSSSDIGANGFELASLVVNSKAVLNNSTNDVYAGAVSVNVGGTLITNDVHADTLLVAGLLDIGANSSTISGISTGDSAVTLAGTSTLNLGTTSHSLSGSFATLGGSTIKLGVLNNTTAGSLVVTGTASLDAKTVLVLNISKSTTLTSGNSYKIVDVSTGSVGNSITNGNIKVNGAKSNRFGNVTFATSLSGGDLMLNTVSLTPSAIAANKLSIAQSNHNIQSGTVGAVNSSVNSTESRMDAMMTQSLYAGNGSSGIASGDSTSPQHAGWAQVFGVNSKQGSFGGLNGYNSNTAGFAAGYDKLLEVGKDFLGDEVRLGLALSYANTNIKATTLDKKTAVDTYQVNAYSSQMFGQYFLDSILGYATNSYNSTASISNSPSYSKYRGNSYVAKIKGGYNYKLDNNFILTPEVMVNYVHNKINAHEDRDSGNQLLNIHAASSDFLEGRLGLALGHQLITKNKTRFLTAIRASYGHDFIGDRHTTVSNFVDQSASFSSQISKVNRNSLKLGSSLDIVQINNVSLKFDYTYEHKTSYHSHTGIVKAKYEF